VRSLNCVRNPIQWARPSRSVESLVEEEEVGASTLDVESDQFIVRQKEATKPFSLLRRRKPTAVHNIFLGKGQDSFHLRLFLAGCSQSNIVTCEQFSLCPLQLLFHFAFDSCFRERYVVLTMEISHCCHFGEASRMHHRTERV
jgi:hypothetical protein